MNRVAAIVEGQTEERFVRSHLAEHLGARGLTIHAVLSGKSGSQGGVKKWDSARGDILRRLREGCYVTTMFDFYGLPDDWPGRTEAARLPWNERGDHVEGRVLEAVAEAFGDKFNRGQFIPYVQVHEFETLLFTDVAKLAETLAPLAPRPEDKLNSLFRQILDEAGGQAEAINDDYETCPSRRILKIVPAYRKLAYGLDIVGSIGLGAIRAACPHFGQWLGRLESISAVGA